MKQQIIELKKKLLLVEIDGKISKEFIEIINKYGMAEILGKVTGVKEEKLAELVETAENGEFKNYNKYGIKSVSTRRSSFLSKLKAEGIYFENKMLEPGSAPIYTHSEKYIEDYKEAQSKVWNLDNCYVFEIL